MNYIIYALIFTSLLLLTACGSSTPITSTPDSFITEEQEFVLTPETSDLETAASIRTPRLVVRLSIKPELDSSGQPTGKRYGQAAFFWTDKSRSNGGSNLGGLGSVALRDANNLNATEFLSHSRSPVMTNIDLYSQPVYEDHLIKTSPVIFKGALCIEVWDIDLVSTNGYKFSSQMTFTEQYDSKPVLSLCQLNPTKTGSELRLVNIKDTLVMTDSGKAVTLPIGIVNSGPRPAENVVISFDIADIGTPEVTDQSGLFDCISISKPEIVGIQISCTALRPVTGLNTLPITFDAASPYDLSGSVYLVEGHITTSSIDSDLSNNTLRSIIGYY